MNVEAVACDAEGDKSQRMHHSGAEEDGGRLQKKDEIITSSDAQPKFQNGRECLLKVTPGK